MSAPKNRKEVSISCSNGGMAELLLVVLGGLHVALLDVLPLALPCELARVTSNKNPVTYPAVQAVPDLLRSCVEAPVVPYQLSCLLAYPSGFVMTYSCMPNAAPKTANNMVVLLRRTALQAMVSRVRSKGVRGEGLACRLCRASTSSC